MIRHPVARGVVDRVPRGSADPEELHLRPAPVPDARDVLVAEPVQLRRSHHHVAPAGRDHVEHGAERHPPLHDLAVRVVAEGLRIRNREGLAVGDQQVGLEGGLRQPGSERRDDTHRAGQDLAVTSPRLRARHHAEVHAAGSGPHDSPRRLRTASWYSCSLAPSRYAPLNAAHASGSAAAAA